MKKLFVASAILAASSMAASAAPITFFAEDETPGASVTAGPSGARDDFLATLSGVSSADFEVGGLNPTFMGSAGSITATLAGGGVSIESLPGAGRFATSGSNYVETSGGGDFTINFSSAISAFGFYGTDIGDINNSLSLQLTLSGGGTVDLNVPNTVGANNGSLLFFGFIDTMASYTSISFLNQPGGSDVFGFDDMVVGDIGQITNPPSEVPLPASVLLLGAAVGGIGAMRKRKKS